MQNAKLIAARPMMIRMKMYPAPIKDHYFLSTILKINDTMDKNYKDKAEKEPGFNRLEEHRKNLILNATATPPFDEKASQPTEFFTAFLSKKSQFKAKDMLVDRRINLLQPRIPRPLPERPCHLLGAKPVIGPQDAPFFM